MNTKEQLEALQDIRNMMNKSTKFLSLSGLSGFFPGLYAIVAGIIAYARMKEFSFLYVPREDLCFITSLALITLLLSVGTAYIFTKRKAKKEGIRMWDESAKNVTVSLCIPLFTGGIFCMALMKHELFGLLAPTTLVFYGLSLVSAAKYTFPLIKHLGLIEIILGLVSLFFIGYGLLFWMFGFGILHIIYGLLMYFKFDRHERHR